MTIRPVLLDNTVLTNFALIQRCDLVHTLWPEVCATSSAVQAEFKAGAESGIFSARAWDELRILSLTAAELELASQLSIRLGAGERTCIALAVHRHGLFVSDDRDARRVAQDYAVAVTGTLGILAAQVRLGRLSLAQGNELLADLIKQNYHSPVTNLDSLL